jgi:ribosomal-protein-alanine N-acetyltransferase
MPRPAAEKLFENLPVIETGRLMLRKVQEGDYNDVFEYANDPETAKYTSWEAHKHIQDSKHFVQFMIKRYAENKPAGWAVVLKENQKMIGTCGFISQFIANKRAETGFVIRKDCAGKGYATEALKAALDFGFGTAGYNRIEACCDVENKASSRVLEKCGMKFEGILRQYVFANGFYHDVKSYAVLRDEYNLKFEI